jgi:Protein of unknown function (DUF3300)
MKTRLVAVLLAVLFAGSLAAAQDQPSAPAAGSAPPPPATAPPPLSTNQIQSLVAPIALFPDPLLTQCLVAATYPIDVIEAEQWLAQNASLTGDALSDAAMKQPWDPSVQSLTAFPTVLKQLASNVAWTANLGNAFLDQKDDVMDAVQTLRQQAQQAGKLQSNDQQTVSTQTVDAKPYVVIQPASTQIVYVPTYSPVAIWGPPAFPYPPIWYPPPIYGGGFAIGFAAGIHFGAWFGGGWGWHMGWGGGWGGHTTIIVNNNNTYIHNTNIHNNTYKTGNGNWQHNASQRGGVPYSRPKSAETRPGAGGAGERQGSDAGRTQGLGAARDGQQAQNRTGDRTAQPRDGQQRGGQNADRNAGRIGNRNVGGSARPNNFSGPRGGDRTHQASARGHQSMPNRGGGNRGGGGEKKH